MTTQRRFATSRRMARKRDGHGDAHTRGVPQVARASCGCAADIAYTVYSEERDSSRCRRANGVWITQAPTEFAYFAIPKARRGNVENF